jgi:hypothetical protein
MKQNPEDWRKDFEDFLGVAELIKKEIDTPKHKEDLCNEGAEILSRQNEVNLRGPLLYIFKHSIELFLKSGIILVNNGCIDSSQFHHNTERLLKDFMSNLDESKEFSLSAESLKKLENIVNKYINLETIDEILSKKKDTENTEFKYPNNNSFEFQYGADDEKLGERVAEIEEDIRSLQMISSELRKHVC